MKTQPLQYRKRQLKFLPLLLMVILFYNFVAGQKILLLPSNAGREVSFEKNYTTQQKPC